MYPHAMPKNTFDYYALHYLNLWVSRDRMWCEALAGSDDSKKLRALAKAAAFYRIARNLRMCYDTGKDLPRYRPILKILDALNPDDFQAEKLLPSIMKVRDKISAEYGKREVLSATTKLLWLKIQSPIIIYDRQARNALKTAPGRIEEYYKKWREEFDRNEQQVRDACTALQKVHRYTECADLTTPEYIAKTTSLPWFRERVFDVYLWRKGLEDR